MYAFSSVYSVYTHVTHTVDIYLQLSVVKHASRIKSKPCSSLRVRASRTVHRCVDCTVPVIKGVH
jgi:hypothetical protein